MKLQKQLNVGVLTLITILISFLMSFSHVAFAQSPRITVMSDDQYFVYDDGLYRFVYTAKDRPLIENLLRYNDVIRDHYQTDFKWRLDERPYVFLLSDRNQVANGYATVFPRLHTVFYPGGAQLPDSFSTDSWLYTLLSHETSHLYQLSNKQGYSNFIHDYFGNSALALTAVFPPFTYTEFPNQFIPPFFLEGNAVLNEGRFGNGGRLFSGDIRATVMRLARAGKVNATRLINEHIDFPYGSEWYWVGSYLQEWLAHTYGIDKVDAFFNEHAKNNGNPFKLREPFIRTFGIGYEDAIKGFLRSWQPIYSTLKIDPAKILFSSISNGGMTKDADEIRFLTTDGISTPFVHLYDLHSHTWSTQRLDVPFGHVFRFGKTLVSAGSAQIDNQNIRSGLFSEGSVIQKGTENKYVYDKRGDHLLYSDATQSFLRFALYNDSTALGATNSTAIYGADNDPYFFRQTGKTRTLYHGAKAVFSFQGYWGFPVEVMADGAVYFIAAAAKGSSLYKWQNGECFRMTDSDVVVDAKPIDAQSAVVAEVSDVGYEYKIVNFNQRKEGPAEYKYDFENSPDEKVFTEAPKSTKQFDAAKERPYSSWRSIKFEGADPDTSNLILQSNGVYVGNLGFRFSDPLLNQYIGLTLSAGSYGYSAVLLNYLNTEHVLNWNILGRYAHAVDLIADPNDNTKIDVLDKYDSWLGGGGVAWPFFVRPEMSSTISSYGIYEFDRTHVFIEDARQNYSILTQIISEWHESTSQAYDPFRKVDLQLAQRQIYAAPQFTSAANVYAAQVDATFDVFHMTYLSASVQDSITDSNSDPAVQLRRTLDPYPIPNATLGYRLTDFTDQTYFEIRKEAVQLKQAFKYGYYFQKFPISVRQFAVYGLYNNYSGALTPHASTEGLFHEAGGGLEVEFLLGHIVPARISYTAVKSSYLTQTEGVFMAGASAPW